MYITQDAGPTVSVKDRSVDLPHDADPDAMETRRKKTQILN